MNNSLENKESSNTEALGVFATLNQAITSRIYDRFRQGQVITKQTYHSGQSALVDDKDYTYLYRYLSAFTTLFALLGKRLEHHSEGAFFYIDNMSEAQHDEADEHALKVQSIILLIARHFEMTGRNMHHLSEPALGFHASDLQDMGNDTEYQAMLKALRIASWDKAVEYLVSRGFAFAMSSQHYFLSSAGNAFCAEVMQAYDALEG